MVEIDDLCLNREDLVIFATKEQPIFKQTCDGVRVPRGLGLHKGCTKIGFDWVTTRSGDHPKAKVMQLSLGLLNLACMFCK